MAKNSLRDKFKTEAEYKAYFAELGRKSRAAYMAKPKAERKPTGFAAMTPEQRAAAGRIGGKKSRKSS